VIFRFIAAKKAEHSIKTMCRVLEVSRSGFHAWQRRAPSARALEDERLTARIREIHQVNRRVYGSPRIHAELVLGDGERIGRKRVERLMRQAGVSGLIARKRGRTTIRVPGVRVCEDLVDRAFLASAPDRLWVADITYLHRRVPEQPPNRRFCRHGQRRPRSSPRGQHPSRRDIRLGRCCKRRAVTRSRCQMR
jgi:transposase InsO family protein